MTPELKPCPFCGGKGIVEMDESWYWEYEAHCIDCTTTLGHFETKEKAIEAWNRRKDESKWKDYVKGKNGCPHIMWRGNMKELQMVIMCKGHLHRKQLTLPVCSLFPKVQKLLKF